MNPHKRTIHCKHYNGAYQHAACEAGVEYASVKSADPMSHALPCVWQARQPEPCGECAKREFPTDDEIAEERRKTVESMEELLGVSDA